MLYGMEVMFPEFEKSGFTFRLTGSRAFKNAKPNSDWDFFVQDSPEVRRYLESLDFSLDPNSQYETGTDVYVNYYNTVHVQLVHSYYQKVQIQTSILEDENLLMVYRSLSKERRKYLWAFLLSRYPL